MDKRLIPPSHFDPGVLMDSLNFDESSCNGRDAYSKIPLSEYVNASPLLRPPNDFTPTNPAPPRFRPGNQLIQGLRQQVKIRDEVVDHGHLPGSSVKARAAKYSELMELKAENNALKSLLESKKKEIVDMLQTSSNDRFPHHAVIEHQTHHISRLQKDLDELKAVINKRENEIVQYESTVASKQTDIRQANEELERTRILLEQKEADILSKEHHIEDLMSEMKLLKSDMQDMADRHNAVIQSIEQKDEEEMDEMRKNFDKRIHDLSTIHEKEKIQLAQQNEILDTKHKQELGKMQKSHADERMDWESRLRDSDNAFQEKLNIAEREIQMSKEECSSVLQNLEEMTAEKEALKNELMQTNASLTLSQGNCEKHQDRVKQLQAYIGELQSADYERLQWKTEKKKYEDKILELESAKESVDKTMELQNIRLQSITKILTTQEEAIHANAKAFSDNKMGNLASVVVRRWREKVLELMINNRYEEIEFKNMENKYQSLEADLKDQLEDEKRVSIILENQLTESNAVLEMKEQEINRLKSGHEILMKRFKERDDKATELENSITSLSELVGSSVIELEKMHREQMEKMVEKLVLVDQRLAFANNRLRTLQDLYARRENLLKAKVKASADKAANQTNSVGEKEAHNIEIERPDLLAEIQRLTEERDSLSRRLSKDSALFKSATAEFKTQETKLLQDIVALQNELQHANEELAEAHITIGELEEKMQGKNHEVIEANDAIKSLQDEQEKVSNQKLEEAWQKWHDEKKEILHKLEESEREHARTVVSCRQSERSATRERKRAAENLKAINDQHTKEIEKLKGKIKSLKLDNNLLLTTLRERGLISVFKAARKEAREVRADSNMLSACSNNMAKSQSCIDSSKSKKLTSPSKSASAFAVRNDRSHIPNPDLSLAHNDPKSPTDMEELIKDLVVMTENILNDSN